MSEGTRRLKANRVVAGRTCDFCGEPIEFGEDTAVCESCETPHHAACWDERGGCSGEGCVNAPLKRLPPKIPPPPVPRAVAPPIPTAAAGPAFVPAAPVKPRVPCIHCGHQMSPSAEFCRRCKRVQTPDGVYRGRKRTAPGAQNTLIFGILSLLICGPVFGILAVTTWASTKKRLENDPRLGGEKTARAGMILGCAGLALHVLAFLVFAATSGGR